MSEERQKQIRELELLIAVNEMLPVDMQCTDHIARMKAKLKHLRAKAGEVMS